MGKEISPGPFSPLGRLAPSLPTSPSTFATRNGNRTTQEDTPSPETWEPTYYAQSSYPTWKDSPYNDKHGPSYYDSPPRIPINIRAHQAYAA